MKQKQLLRRRKGKASRSRKHSSRRRSRSRIKAQNQRHRSRRRTRSRKSRRSYKGGAGKNTIPIDLTNDDDFTDYEGRSSYRNGRNAARTSRPSGRSRHHPYSRPAFAVSTTPFPRITNRADISEVPTVPPEMRKVSLQVLREEEQKKRNSQPNLFVDLEELEINTMGGVALQAENKSKMLAFYDLLHTRNVVTSVDQPMYVFRGIRLNSMPDLVCNIDTVSYSSWNWKEALEYAIEPNESEMEEFAERMYEGEDWVDTKIALVMVIRLAPNTPIMVEGEAAGHIVLPPGYRFQPYGVEFRAKLLPNPNAPEHMQPYVMYFDYVRC